jgi:hypothetical protein
MVKALGMLGDRLLSLVVPRAEASACRCWTVRCPGGNGSVQECCKVGGQVFCDGCT